MRFKFASLLILAVALGAVPAHAQWQYPDARMRDSWYADDGSRFILSFRGGAALGRGSVKNDIGSLTAEYWINPNDGMVITAEGYLTCTDCGDFVMAGLGDIANLPATKNFSSFSFAAGASLGWRVAHSPQWRLEVGWDHITESEYNAAPLFEGDLALEGGVIPDVVVRVQSGGAHSTVSTDIFSVMAFYDFFDGLLQPTNKLIPYVGFGLGYADSKTVLNLADLYGDLTPSIDLGNYGDPDMFGVLQFFQSEKSTANVAGLLALGVSYGLTESTHLDFGIRFTYVPKIRWALSNEDGSRHRNWFSANDIFYTNIMAGIRFEF